MEGFGELIHGPRALAYTLFTLLPSPSFPFLVLSCLGGPTLLTVGTLACESKFHPYALSNNALCSLLRSEEVLLGMKEQTWGKAYVILGSMVRTVQARNSGS